MLLRPSNTLLLDEPTNHLDLDSKDVLLDALVDYGGTLIFVSHDRYFVERLATKIIEVGNGTALTYPGTYTEFLWHKEHPAELRDTRKAASEDPRRDVQIVRKGKPPAAKVASPAPPEQPRQEKKRVDAEARKRERTSRTRQAEIDALEARIAESEQAIREIEQTMAAPGFYDDRAAAQPVIDRHQALMWRVGDLMHQWEELQMHEGGEVIR
jgi:ATP-binding cassette subfamily F protein 3